MEVHIFPTADALVKYVNDNTILQSSIVTIREKDGQWYIFHY